MWKRSIFVALLLAASLTSGVSAQKKNTPAGITVTPVVDEFEVQPGGQTTRTVRVINPVKEEMTLYPRILNFHTDNENGQPVFFTDKERFSTFGLANWVTFSKPFLRITPNEEERFEVVVSVPADAEPGGHYGAILFSTEEPKLDEDLSQIGVVGLVGTLLLARVPGEITEKLAVTEFNSPSLIFQPPANFSLLFENLGNVHLKPRGEIKIRNWSGKLSTALKINELGGNVLPESKRRFENQWQFDWKTIGRYTATAVVAYGTEKEQSETITRIFYVIPLWLIIALIALILILTAWITRRRRRKPPVVLTNALPPTPATKQPRYVMR